MLNLRLTFKKIVQEPFFGTTIRSSYSLVGSFSFLPKLSPGSPILLLLRQSVAMPHHTEDLTTLVSRSQQRRVRISPCLHTQTSLNHTNRSALTGCGNSFSLLSSCMQCQVIPDAVENRMIRVHDISTEEFLPSITF